MAIFATFFDNKFDTSTHTADLQVPGLALEKTSLPRQRCCRGSAFIVVKHDNAHSKWAL
jgi:hypothetical protein